MLRTAPLSMLQVGTVLGSPIHDQRGQLMLGRGTEVTQEFLVKLHKRGVRSLVIDEKDWRKMNAFASQGMAKRTLTENENWLVNPTK